VSIRGETYPYCTMRWRRKNVKYIVYNYVRRPVFRLHLAAAGGTDLGPAAVPPAQRGVARFLCRLL